MQLVATARSPEEDLRHQWKAIVDVVVYCDQHGAAWLGPSSVWGSFKLPSCVCMCVCACVCVCVCVGETKDAQQTPLPSAFGSIFDLLLAEEEALSGETVRLRLCLCV